MMNWQSVGAAAALGLITMTTGQAQAPLTLWQWWRTSLQMSLGTVFWPTVLP